MLYVTVFVCVCMCALMNVVLKETTGIRSLEVGVIGDWELNICSLHEQYMALSSAYLSSP